VTPRYQAIHTTLFVAGMLALPLGLVLPRSGVLLFGGLCFVASGLMTILGHRFTMRGPVGRLMRRLVGGVRLGGAYLVGTLWLLLGVFMLQGTPTQPEHAPPPVTSPPAAEL